METPDKNRKRVQDLRWNAFQSILVGTVIIMVMALFCFISMNMDDTGSHAAHWGRGSGVGYLFFIGVWGLWMIIRGVIYLIRAISGNEQYGKSVQEAVDKSFESGYQAMTKRRGNASTHNVAVLFGWVFLFFSLAMAIFLGYLFLTRPR